MLIHTVPIREPIFVSFTSKKLVVNPIPSRLPFSIPAKVPACSITRDSLSRFVGE